MTIGESVRTSMAEIRTHKLRSLLTLVGIILGTTSLVVMVSVIGGAAVAVEKGLSDLGFDGVMFVSGQAPTERLELKKQGYSRGLRTADLQIIDSGKELVQAAAPVVFGRETALLGGRSLVVNIEGITPAYGVIRNRTAEKGRFLVDRDLETVAPVCVIGNQLAKDVYGTEDPLGREVAIRGVRFRVVGVLRSLGSSQVNDDDMARDNSKVYLPLTTMQKHFLGGDSVQAYAFKVHDPERLKDGQKEVEALLRRGHRGISDFKVDEHRRGDPARAQGGRQAHRQLDGGAGLHRRHLAAGGRHRHLLGDADLHLGAGLRDRPAQVDRRHRRLHLRAVPRRVGLAVAGGRAAGQPLGWGITMLASQAFEDGLTVSPMGLLMAAGFAVLIGLTAGRLPGAQGLAPHAGGRHPRRLAFAGAVRETHGSRVTAPGQKIEASQPRIPVSRLMVRCPGYKPLDHRDPAEEAWP